MLPQAWDSARGSGIGQELSDRIQPHMSQTSASPWNNLYVRSWCLQVSNAVEGLQETLWGDIWWPQKTLICLGLSEVLGNDVSTSREVVGASSVYSWDCKRRMWTILTAILWLTLAIERAKAAIVPPAWADPSKNPCATQPGGWQLLFWPPDGKCYRIFQMGAPCPETMELSPAAESGGVVAECKCPPGTAQSPRDALCHRIFTRGSCSRGQYFAPVAEVSTNGRRWGVCREPESCPERGELFWPRDGRCYHQLTRGPCPKGQLLTVDSKSGLAACSCSPSGQLGAYYWAEEVERGCYEHYSKGPCSEPGELFLPGAFCGCTNDLPHFHVKTGKCYTLGSIGPCPRGHHFVVNTTSAIENEDMHAKCFCKPGYVLYKDGFCYRPHTRGPCGQGRMLVNSSDCVPLPCQHGRLYFAQEKTCYKIGTRGPCSNGQVVTYDRSVRPSVDGISYNGVCECTNESKFTGNCTEQVQDSCEDTPGMFIINKVCYKLYTQGPCGQGEWLVARRQPRSRDTLWRSSDEQSLRSRVECECRPGYRRVSSNSEASDVDTNALSALGECQPPSFGIAKFLNDHRSELITF